jgi:hypothetical protein
MVGFSFLKKGLLSLMLFGAFFLLSAKIYAEDPTPTPRIIEK